MSIPAIQAVNQHAVNPIVGIGQTRNNNHLKVVQERTYKRGDVWLVNLGKAKGSEQGGERPVMIIQNDIGNKHSPTVIVAAISSQLKKAKQPTHVMLDAELNGLEYDSVLLCEQIRTIDKRFLISHKTTLDASVMGDVNKALSISMGLM